MEISDQFFHIWGVINIHSWSSNSWQHFNCKRVVGWSPEVKEWINSFLSWFLEGFWLIRLELFGCFLSKRNFTILWRKFTKECINIADFFSWQWQPENIVLFPLRAIPRGSTPTFPISNSSRRFECYDQIHCSWRDFFWLLGWRW